MSYMGNGKCEKCGKDCKDLIYGWCKQCYIPTLINTNWTSGNAKIDSLIKEMQDKRPDIVFEWISYNQFENIEEISNGNLATIYSATWNDGPLYYHHTYNEYIRRPDKKVALKCIHNSKNVTYEFLNEVWNYFINLLIYKKSLYSLYV